MKARIFKWAGLATAAVVLLAGLALFWIVSAESGTRWIVARIEPFLPEPLAIGRVDGTLLRGIELVDIQWQDVSTDASISRLFVHAELRPLLRREVRLSRLYVREVAVDLRTGGRANGDDGSVNFELPFTLDVREALIERVRLDIGDELFEIDRIDLQGRLAGSRLNVQRLSVRSEIADVDLEANAGLSGDYPARVSAAWQLRLAGQPTFSGRLSVDGNRGGYAINHELAAPYRVVTVGRLEFPDATPQLDINNTWRDIQVSLADDRTLSLANGRLRLAGSPASLAFDGGTTARLGDMPQVTAVTRGSLVDNLVTLDLFELVGEAGRLQAIGELVIAPEVAWDLRIEAQELDPSYLDPRFDGRLRMTGRTTGSLGDQGPDAELLIERVAGRLNDYPVEGNAELAYRDSQIVLHDALARVGDNEIAGKATFGESLQADATLRLAKLEQLGIEAGGSVNGRVQLRSDLDDFVLRGDVRGETLAWQDYRVDTVSSDFNLRTAGSGSAELQIAGARIGDLAISTVDLTIDGDLGSHQLKLALGLDEVRSELRLTGGTQDETWSGTVESLQIVGEVPGEWRLRDASKLVVSRSATRLENTCIENISARGTACIGLEYKEAGALQFAATVRNYPVAALPLTLPDGAGMQGVITAAASGQVDGHRISADGTLSIADLLLSAQFEGDEVSVAFDATELTAGIIDNRLTAELRVNLRGSSDRVRARLEVADIRDMGSAIRGSGDLEISGLELVGFFVPDITNPSGRIHGSVDVAGTMVAPEIVGEVQLIDGNFGIRRAGITVDALSISLRQAQPGLLALKGQARAGEGRLDIEGTTSISADSGIRTELVLQGEAFPLVRLPDWYVTASPAIGIVFDDRELRVSGDLGIPAATINIRGIPESAEKSSPDVVVHRDVEQVQTVRRRYFIDVRTSLGDAVSFSGFGLATRLEGNVRIAASSSVPLSGNGRVVLREGKYKAYGQTLDIESGELVFNGPIDNPALNVRANRKASDGTAAGIHLTGTAQQLRSEVYSEPALSDAEALSYLLTGRPLASANSAEGDMLNQAAFALGLTSAGSIASSIRDQLGLDTLGIQGGAENRQFVAGKRLNDRLLVEYAYGLIDNLGTLLLRYQLSSRLVVESRSGSVRNLDLVYSVKRP